MRISNELTKEIIIQAVKLATIDIKSAVVIADPDILAICIKSREYINLVLDKAKADINDNS